MSLLVEYGWNDENSSEFDRLEAPGLVPGRVLFSSAGTLRVLTTDGERTARVSGRLRHAAVTPAELPVVGDWVALRTGNGDLAVVERVLSRRSVLSRNAAGDRTDEQVVAANVDVVFVMTGLDGDFSVRRIERLLATVWESGARPVVVLNKLDLCGEPDRRLAEVTRVSPGVPVLLSSCETGDGIDELARQIRPSETAVLIGSSGVGKSSLINRLLEDTVQSTREVRTWQDRGRHTTTSRELFRLPGGGMIIDNPGIREVQLWCGEDSLDRAFEDVAELAGGCRYRDCAHDSEPGCAVLAGVESGEIDAARLASYRELQKELRFLRLRQDQSLQKIERNKWRAIHREMRKSGRHRGR